MFRCSSCTELLYMYIPLHTQNSGSTSAPRLRLAAQHGGRRESSLVGYIHSIFYVISRVICRRSEDISRVQGAVSGIFQSMVLKKYLNPFYHILKHVRNRKKKSVFLICLSAVFANTISWMTLCCDLKCLVPDLFFFLQIQSNVRIYIHRPQNPLS